MNSTKALSRTWNTITTYRECGVVVDVARNTVTLSREVLGGPLLATIDGQAAQVDRADRLLRNADTVTVTAEVLAPGTIGKARGARLHKLLARVGVAQHYNFAADSLGKPCRSLAALTEFEARQVWLNVCRWFPSARSFKGVAA